MKRRRINFKSILGIVLIIILVFAVIGGIGSCAKDETDNVSMFEFERGDLDKNGQHVESKRAVYTKKAFECLGLKCTPDFDSHLSYSVYYYDSEDNFLDSVTGLTRTYEYDHPFATHARVVIYPDVPEDENEDDYEIPFYKVYTVANKLDITVSEKQTNKYSKLGNLYDELNCTVSRSFQTTTVGEKLTPITSLGMKITEEISVPTGYEKFDIYVRSTEGSTYEVVASSESDVILAETSTTSKAGSWYKLTLDLTQITDTVEYIRCSLPSEASCYIFGYK